ncbi:dihydrolipoyl dehydrogenase [Bosea sp. (in: a-proteobacteria)]|uniref:dihydrolipoyl dehydrogenase n=1 Tax=Bosea sp. (in: a-proteobacteria) TaxID=1871050 RepID=UPI003B39FB6A
MSASPARSLVVIGGGIGGYTAAIRAARAGLDVTLVEKVRLGGTCLNIGCIPTKSLLHHARRFRAVQDSQDFGVDPDTLSVDFDTLMAHKAAAVAKLVGGVETLVRRNKIRLVGGTAAFRDAATLEIAESGERLTADAFIIATGSEPILPDLPGIDLAGVVTSEGVLSLPSLPRRLLIVGGGVIGVEFAQIFVSLGVAVTLVERLDRILAEEDADIAAALADSLGRQGVTILTSASVSEIASTEASLVTRLSLDGRHEAIDADTVLIAVGRRPLTQGLGLERIGVATERNAIATDDGCRTAISHIYAIGDARGGLLLAHKAAAEAECAVSNLLGKPSTMAPAVIPRAVYTSPGVAAAGLTEAEARVRHAAIRVGRFPFSASGKATADGAEDGFVKIVADAETQQILGISMIGEAVTELLGEATLAVQMELTLEALAHTVHAHPTFGEALAEAAYEAMDAGAIHLPPRSRPKA